MNALYVNDTAKGAGHGFLRIAGAPLFASLPGLSFSIKRTSDQKSLGPGGWQHAHSALTPDAASPIADDLALAVGPGVVDNLDPRESYRLTLRSPDGASAVCSLQAPEVAYSPLAGGHGVAEAPAPEPAPSPDPPPTAAPDLAPDPAPEPDPPADGPSGVLPPLPDAAPQQRRSPLPVIALLLVLAATAFAFWRNTGTGDATKADKGEAARQEEAAPAENAPQPGTDAPPPPLARARAHLARQSGPADPAASLALARELGKEAGGADAVFLLLEDAAQQGDSGAMLLVGGFYDPADAAPSGSIIKDPEQAFAWYAKAQAKGQPEAAARLEALRAWAESEAAKGADGARPLLRRFN